VQTTQKSYIVHGPQGSGKSLHAKAIAKALGLSKIKDEWDGTQRSWKPTNTLYLIQEVPRWVPKDARRVLSIDEAKKLIAA
jgi:predicted ATPase